jgi:hypothetical protein
MNKLVFFKLILITLLHFSHLQLFCQHFEFSTGYGFYESMTASTKFVTSKGVKYGLSVGFDNSIIFQGKYLSAMFDVQKPLLKKYYSGLDYRNTLEFDKYKHGADYRYFLDFKFIYWNLVDEYYYWHSISFIPSFGRNYQFSYHWTLSVDAGVMFNFVLNRGRLNYLNAGWPYKVMPNFRVLINYKL